MANITLGNVADWVKKREIIDYRTKIGVVRTPRKNDKNGSFQSFPNLLSASKLCSFTRLAELRSGEFSLDSRKGKDCNFQATRTAVQRQIVISTVLLVGDLLYEMLVLKQELATKLHSVYSYGEFRLLTAFDCNDTLWKLFSSEVFSKRTGLARLS